MFAVICQEESVLSLKNSSPEALTVVREGGETLSNTRGNSEVYYTHFEITDGPCNLIGSNWCDLFTMCTIFCFKSHLFPSQ